MIAFRHADPRQPFFWEDALQPAGRWHAAGDGPAQYLANSPDAAWAEFLRHEEIRDPSDLATVRRALWAIEIDSQPVATPDLPGSVMTGGLASYVACQREARRLRRAGGIRLEAPSAALSEDVPWVVRGGLRRSPARVPRTLVFFGVPALEGWRCVAEGRPHEDLLKRVRPLER